MKKLLKEKKHARKKEINWRTKDGLIEKLKEEKSMEDRERKENMQEGKK